ncbi:MAG: YraN family protein [Lachnospiraceae bacterium]|jgi:putative endonuclease|nr:YraN family protein [Lachnospiraceae bacterium]
MSKRSVGDIYEQKAAQFLEKKGYQILARNYHTRFGEIDLVALDEGVLCFVEVKYRKDNRFGSPQEAVDVKKQKRLSYSAAVYVMKEKIGLERAMRFDVVGILGEEYVLIKDAFPYLGD